MACGRGNLNLFLLIWVKVTCLFSNFELLLNLTLPPPHPTPKFLPYKLDMMVCMFFLCNFNVVTVALNGFQGTIIIKSPKKSPIFLRMIVLVFAMVCGVYICSVCLNQTNFGTTSKLLNVEINKRHCCDYEVDRSQTPYAHYPKPETFSRYTFNFSSAINLRSHLSLDLMLISSV